MIRANSFFRSNFSVGNQSKHFDKRKLMFGVVDFAAEQGNPGPIFLRIVNEFESIVRSSSAASENAYYQVRIVLRKFFHGPRAVIHNLQKEWPAGFRHARQAADDVVVYKFTKLFRWNAAVDVRI